tara:strand:- start:8865 stop:9191 length:327 start_codon:yes stop_codon:yes gene_type:complete
MSSINQITQSMSALHLPSPYERAFAHIKNNAAFHHHFTDEQVKWIVEEATGADFGQMDGEEWLMKSSFDAPDTKEERYNFMCTFNGMDFEGFEECDGFRAKFHPENPQ